MHGCEAHSMRLDGHTASAEHTPLLLASARQPGHDPLVERQKHPPATRLRADQPSGKFESDEGTQMTHDRFNTLREFRLASGKRGRFYSLPALEDSGIGPVSRLSLIHISEPTRPY